jgi:hypothetical protein
MSSGVQGRIKTKNDSGPGEEPLSHGEKAVWRDRRRPSNGLTADRNTPRSPRHSS